MPQQDYRVRDSQTGRVITLRGDAPPTEAELIDIFGQLTGDDEAAQAAATAKARGESFSPQLAAEAERRGLRAIPVPSVMDSIRNSALNPVRAISGLVRAVANPMETGRALLRQPGEQLEKAITAGREGRYSEAAGHGLASVVPILGPAAASIGERMKSGDLVGGAADLTALAVVPAAARGAVGVASRAAQATGQGLARFRLGASPQAASAVLDEGLLRTGVGSGIKRADRIMAADEATAARALAGPSGRVPTDTARVVRSPQVRETWDTLAARNRAEPDLARARGVVNELRQRPPDMPAARMAELARGTRTPATGTAPTGPMERAIAAAERNEVAGVVPGVAGQMRRVNRLIPVRDTLAAAPNMGESLGFGLLTPRTYISLTQRGTGPAAQALYGTGRMAARTAQPTAEAMRAGVLADLLSRGRDESPASAPTAASEPQAPMGSPLETGLSRQQLTQFADYALQQLARPDLPAAEREALTIQLERARQALVEAR